MACLGVLSLLLTGCASTSDTAGQYKQIDSKRVYAFQQPGKDYAQLRVTRLKTFAGGKCFHGVMIDGVEAARFGVDEQFVFHVPPGTHMFRVLYDWTAQDDCAVTEDRLASLGRAKKVVLEANSIYDYRIGFDSGSGRIKLFIDHVGKDISQ